MLLSGNLPSILLNRVGGILSFCILSNLIPIFIFSVFRKICFSPLNFSWTLKLLRRLKLPLVPLRMDLFLCRLMMILERWYSSSLVKVTASFSKNSLYIGFRSLKDMPSGSIITPKISSTEWSPSCSRNSLKSSLKPSGEPPTACPLVLKITKV